ncbi:MAG: hypothetical protein FWE95_10940 [Planctomycetaceae bacterium]|nr:hypothetical protein [Planctomycetaceae bacterium]
MPHCRNDCHYKTDWREPKLLCIYFLDENGNVDRTIPPILDGTMGNVRSQKTKR